MSELKRINELYVKDEIEKQEYIKQMHDIHLLLFDYSEYLKSTDIQKIDIRDDSVVMTSRMSTVSIVCDKYDYRTAPIEILNFKNYEKNESDMIFKICDKVISDSSVIFDVGANIGWYTVNLAKKFHTSTIYAFEPVKRTFDYLTTNCILNGVKNVTRVQSGLSNVEGKMDMYYYPEGAVNASLKNLTDREDIEIYSVNILTLDGFFKDNNLQGVDFIKCDVEGAELHVFQGGSNIISKYKPVVFTEILRKWSEKFNYHPNDIISQFREIGYRCFVVAGSNLREFLTVDEETIETNYFFLHSSKHADLIESFC